MMRFYGKVVGMLVLALGLGYGLHIQAAEPPKVGEKLADVELSVLNGEKIQLSKLTSQGPVVFVVLRGYPGYQCPLCSKQAGEFLGKSDAFKQAKAQVVFVYPGSKEKLTDHAKEFFRGKDYPAHFYLTLDPDYKIINQLNLRWNAANETAYPSTFVLDTESKITFAKISKTHGGRAGAAEALKALPTK